MRYLKSLLGSKMYMQIQYRVDSALCSGWGEAVAMNPWTRDVLGDLACALYSCGLQPIPCMEGTARTSHDLPFRPPDMCNLRALQCMYVLT